LAAVLAGVRKRVAVNHLALGVSVRWLRYVHVLLGMLGVYSKIVFVGESSRRDADGLPRRFLDRSIVIPNAVPLPVGDRARARAQFGIAQDAFVFLNVGSLSDQKNQDVLVRAALQLPGAVLVIVGDGPRREHLAEWALHSNGRVRILGRVPLEEMGDIYAMADVFVFPSLFEGRPLALLEAARAGLPVIASPIPENLEVTGAAADYVNPNDVEGWERAMGRVLNDRQHHHEMQQAMAELDVGSDETMVLAYLRAMA
jgi:alpha-1,3-rhamnosyl/mannosyltransferase